jgi:ABC-type branched-subunit amino acid transport system ATPase component
METISDKADGARAATLLSIEKVTRRFGGLLALDEVAFTIAPGEVVCLIGPNGSGKTTLFNIVSGLLQPSAGAVLFRGKPINGMPPHLIAARGIGRTFQNARLFPNLSLLDNLLVPQFLRSRNGLFNVLFCASAERAERRAFRERAEALLGELAGGRLYARRLDYPDSCSLGERRMIEIMRVLALDPELVLMDEPTQGLNPVWVAEMLQLIESVRRRGKTILLVEHKMAVVMRVADRIVVLNSGRKICDGPPEQVRADPLVLHAYLGQ